MAGQLKRIFFLLVCIFFIGILSFLLIPTQTTIQKENFQYKIGDKCTNCNVILISVDSLRADHVNTYGYARATTPNFDRISQSGALFLNYFTTSFLTPVSEASVHTGMYPSSNGVTNFDTVLPKNKLTLAQYLKNLEYNTFAVLSSPEFEVNPALKESFSAGFDSYNYFNLTEVSDSPGSIKRQYPTLDTYNSFLSDKKFFLWLAVGGVHWPYGDGVKNIYADENYQGVFKNKKLDWNEFQNVYQGKYYPQGENIQAIDTQYVWDMYDNGVQAFDVFLGQVLSNLENRDLLKNTIIIIQSEHGEGLGENGYFAHYDVLDTQIHTPLLIIGPTVKDKQRIEAMSSSVDIFPTLVELLGESLPKQLQGKSFASLITGRQSSVVSNEIFTERNPLWEEAHLGIRNSLTERGISVVSGKYNDIAIRTTQWKYILRLSKNRMQQISWWQTVTGKTLHFPSAELYDLKNDPLETKNVIEMHPEIASDLRKKLEAWYTKISTDSSKIEHKVELQPYF
jgi:arylsulfatase A-like enzyme